MEFKEQIANGIKANNKRFFKSIRSKKPVKESVDLLDHQEFKREIKAQKDTAEKLNNQSSLLKRSGRFLPWTHSFLLMKMRYYQRLLQNLIF